MTTNTKIEWADHTFNPWVGCTKVSPACDHCYAETWAKRSGMVQWGPGAPRRRTTDHNWQQPRKWNADAAVKGIRYRVFCASLADVFDNDVPTSWRIDLFSLIAETPNLDWLILTKRIGNVAPMCTGDGMMFDLIAERVWLGISVVDQAEANRDIDKLLAVPAHIRFLSCEPLLGPLTIFAMDGPIDIYSGASSPLHWVIAGGESGPGARPMHPDWPRLLRDQCKVAGVPFLFKQWGEWAPRDQYDSEWMESDEICAKWNGTSYRFGKKAAGRILDGRTHDQFPA